MKARDVMTARVISIETDAPVMRAVHLMLQNRISGLPVLGPKGELVGMVTEGDFIRRGEIGTQRRRCRSPRPSPDVELGGSNVVSILMRVLLPEPLGPIRPKRSRLD